MRQINRVNFYFALSHFDFNIRIKKKMFRSSRNGGRMRERGAFR